MQSGTGYLPQTAVVTYLTSELYFASCACVRTTQFVPTLSNIEPVHTTGSYFLKFRFLKITHLKEVHHG
jgi:hypothetical protein